MNRITLNTVAVLMLSLAPLAAQQRQRPSFGRSTNTAASTNLPSTDFRAFNVVTSRNIFNANRYPGYVDRGPVVTRAPFDTFTLLGTLSYEKGLFAFFGGNQSSFRKTLGPNDAIAGYRITEIGYDHVSLVVSNEPPITLPIGGQMRRDEQGPWRVMGRSEPTPAAADVATSSDSSTSSASATDSESDPVLKRLMEKRRLEQEGK